MLTKLGAYGVMQKFPLKQTAQLSEQDFIDYPAWVDYYEPDDIIALGDLGYDVIDLSKAIKATGYSDSYSFPVPADAIGIGFQHIRASVRASPTGSVRKFVGYITHASLTLFVGGKAYGFNPNLRERSEKAAEALATAIAAPVTFPFDYTITANGKTGTFVI